MPDSLLASQEPPSGSVVAIDWGGAHPEVWVSNCSNIGCWYTTDIPLPADRHPHWEDVVARAQGRALTLLTPGDEATWTAGYRAGAQAVADAVTRAAEEALYEHTYRPESREQP